MYALKRTRSLGPGFTGTVQALLGQFRFYMTVSGLDAFAQCPEKKKLWDEKIFWFKNKLTNYSEYINWFNLCKSQPLLYC